MRKAGESVYGDCRGRQKGVVEMWNDLCAEQMKYRHTFLGKAFLVAPLLTLLLGIKLSPAYVVLTSFNWWYMFLLPAMLSIVSCSCGEKDRKLGEKAVFTVP